MTKIIKQGLVSPDGKQVTSKKPRLVASRRIGYQGGFAALNWLEEKDARMVAEVIMCQAAKTRILANYGADSVPDQAQAEQAIFETIASFVAAEHVENFDPKSGFVLMGPEGPEITMPVMVASEDRFVMLPKSAVMQEAPADE